LYLFGARFWPGFRVEEGANWRGARFQDMARKEIGGEGWQIGRERKRHQLLEKE